MPMNTMHVEFRFADAFKTDAYTIVHIVCARVCLCPFCESLYACVCVLVCVCVCVVVDLRAHLWV